MYPCRTQKLLVFEMKRDRFLHVFVYRSWTKFITEGGYYRNQISCFVSSFYSFHIKFLQNDRETDTTRIQTLYPLDKPEHDEIEGLWLSCEFRRMIPRWDCEQSLDWESRIQPWYKEVRRHWSRRIRRRGWLKDRIKWEYRARETLKWISPLRKIPGKSPVSLAYLLRSRKSLAGIILFIHQIMEIL